MFGRNQHSTVRQFYTSIINKFKKQQQERTYALKKKKREIGPHLSRQRRAVTKNMGLGARSGSSLDPAPDQPSDFEQVTSPLWVSDSLTVKWN